MALQTVTGPQTTVWLLYSVPNCAGVALSSEWLVYSLYSFQPLACFLPVRAVLFILLHSPARKGNSSSQTRAFLPFLLIPGTFVSNSQGRILKISSLVGLQKFTYYRKCKILVNCWPESAIKSLHFKNTANRKNCSALKWFSVGFFSSGLTTERTSCL